MTRQLLTHTRMATFKECRRKYKYRFVDLLELRAAKGGRRRGSAFGSAIFNASQAGEGGPWAEAIRNTVDDHYLPLLEAANSTEERWELEVEAAKVRVMARLYIARYGFDSRRELTFETKLKNPASGYQSRTWRRAGKIDGLINMGGKKVRMIEDKFVSQITPVMIQRLPLDQQITEYADVITERGWDVDVAYRHTRLPGINPEKAKEFKTKPDRPAESIDDFEVRLVLDAAERPDFYFSEQIVVFDRRRLEEYREERWQLGRTIGQVERSYRKDGRDSWFFKTTSHCLDFGGCEYLPLCTDGWDAAGPMYVGTTPSPELG